MRALPFLVILLLGGCNDSAFEFLERLSGTRSNVVILSSTSVALGDTAVEFQVGGDAIVLGKYAAVCAVLAGDFSLQAARTMDAEYDRLLDGAKFKATVSTQSGESHELCEINQSWSKYGKVLDRDELSACARMNCSATQIASGTAISSISIVSNKPLMVKGLYWESTNAWDNASN